jgi:hypothetical protein
MRVTIEHKEVIKGHIKKTHAYSDFSAPFFLKPMAGSPSFSSSVSASFSTAFTSNQVEKGDEDNVSIKDFLVAPLVIRAFSPLNAKLIDDHIRFALAEVIHVIQRSETLPKKGTFEL